MLHAAYYMPARDVKVLTGIRNRSCYLHSFSLVELGTIQLGKPLNHVLMLRVGLPRQTDVTLLCQLSQAPVGLGVILDHLTAIQRRGKWKSMRSNKV